MYEVAPSTLCVGDMERSVIGGADGTVDAYHSYGSRLHPEKPYNAISSIDPFRNEPMVCAGMVFLI